MKFYALLPGILTAGLLCANLNASAYTPDDVAQKAREAGWPETLIQTGYNEWSSGEYTQSDLDDAYYSVLDYNDQSEQFICNALGVDPEKVKAKSAENADAAPEESSETVPEESVPAETIPGESVSADAGNQPVTEPKASDERIASSEFISMSLEEKQDYISSLEEEQKTEFVASLSREERNSIIKQLSTEEKLSLMQNYIDTASTMGMNVVVDNISEQDISVTVRNNDGIVIDKAAVGIVIDETGIPRTKPLLFAGTGILTALSGFILLYRYGSRSDDHQKGASS